MIRPILAFTIALLPASVLAQETINVGVLNNQDVSVVQDILYPKANTKEFGFHVGWMPFDAFTTTPLAALTYTSHRSEIIGYEFSLGGGYGLKNQAYRALEEPEYAIAPDAYRYLGSALLDAQFSPIYAKMNVGGNRIFHHDVYGLAGFGLTVEQAIIPDNDLAFSPTAGIGIGARIFLGGGRALRVQLRDDFLVQIREKTSSSQGPFIKQNVALTVGIVKLKR